MNKTFFTLLILLSPLNLFSETNQKIDKKCVSSFDNQSCLSTNESKMKIQNVTPEDIKQNITLQNEFNSLSQYGIIDYASAVKWCRKKISENYDYKIQVEKIDLHPADFCRTYFNPLIQSNSSQICENCELELDPNLILENLFEEIAQPQNSYGIDLDISEEIYSERNFILPTEPYEKSKSFSVQPYEKSKSFLDKPDKNRKRTYFTGSIGLSKINDISVQNISSNIEFDAGLGIDIGIGYDFGRNRFEASWVRSQSDGVSLLGYSIESDSKINSFLVSYYYDFRNNKKWSPFIGTSIGSTNLDIDGVEDAGLTYGLGYGLSYKTSEVTDFFLKGQTVVVSELNFGTISVENSNYTNATFGIRYRF